jgi:hypothetical protein
MGVKTFVSIIDGNEYSYDPDIYRLEGGRKGLAKARYFRHVNAQLYIINICLQLMEIQGIDPNQT